MDWLSKCVCGSSATNTRNPDKESSRKKKSLRSKKRSEKYETKSTDVTREETVGKNFENEEKLVALVKGHQYDDVKSEKKVDNRDASIVDNLNRSRGKGDSRKEDDRTSENVSRNNEVSRFNEARIDDENSRDSTTRSLTSGKLENRVINAGNRGQIIHSEIIDEQTFDCRETGEINFFDSQRVRSKEKSDKFQGKNFNDESNDRENSLDYENTSPRQTKKFPCRSSVPASPINDRDFRINSNSCSFVIPMSSNFTKVPRNVEKKISSSQIPKPSTKFRGNKDTGEGDIERIEKINKNGRVHSAIVSGVNWEQRSVTVEWFEKGETKGKEVEIDAILALNPELMPKSMPPPQMNNMLSSTRARHSTRPSIPVKAGSNRQIRQTGIGGGGRPTNIMPPASSVNGHSETVAALTGRREVENIPPTPTMPVSVTTTSLNKQKAIQLQQQQQQLQQQQQQQAAVNAQQASQQVENGRGRRSNVVKEVERLKKNREERRQRQAELKEEKEALMNLDPGNPNWEFLAMIREYQSSIDFRPLRETDTVEDHQITVCVRKRPLNRKEVNRKEVDVISVPSKDQMVVHEPKAKVDLTKYLENQLFRFDYAFDETCNNEIVYKYTAKPLVQTIFEGGMATCFAYGQTGSGKTHTMGGDFNGKTQDCKKGIYAMVAKDVFKCLKSPKFRSLNLIISASFFEIYSGKVFDLLADKEKLRVLEDGKQQVQIVGLTEKVVETCDEVLKLIQHGNCARTSGQTSANANSSRSHAVFQIIARTPTNHKVHGKFSLIDLAGNERGADTSSANRQTRMEGAEINKSLLALKECIRALGRKGTHLPFRASKLTQVLRDSFIGEKSKTCMIAMISPGLSSCEHSLNTLRYADRVKELAATDPTEMKISPTDDDRVLKIEDEANNSALSDSDLAQLRSLNEGELSQDLYTFHEAVSALQILEEEVLDTHKAVMENTTSFLNDAHNVFSSTHEVDYDQEDASSRSNTIFALSSNWNDEPDDTIDRSINFFQSSDTGSDCDNDVPIFYENTNDTVTSINRSPWRYESQGSSGNVSSAGTDRKTPRIGRRRNSNVSLNCRKTCLSKNSSVKTTSSKKKGSSTSRGKWSTVSSKNNSKYSWTGTFNQKGAKRSIFPPFNASINHEERGKETEKPSFDSLTRSSSPVDEKYYYSSDSDIEAKIFGLKESGSKLRAPSCYRESGDSRADSRRCGEHSIEDPDIGECNNREDIGNEDYRKNCENELTSSSNDCGDYRRISVNPDERTNSRLGDDSFKFGTSSFRRSTLRASWSSTRSSSSSRSSYRQNSIVNVKLTERSMNLDDEVFEPQSTRDTDVFKSTADLWIDDETSKNQLPPNCKISHENVTEKEREVSKIRKIIRSMGHFFFTIMKNVILFSILPMAYIAFFIYVQTREDKDGDLY